MRKLGFTLIEILIVFSLIGVLFVIGYAGLRDFSRRQALESVARSIRGDLRLTQQYAITGKKPLSCGDDWTLEEYSFYIHTQSEYSVGAVCTNPEAFPFPSLSCAFGGGDMCIKIIDLDNVTISIKDQPSGNSRGSINFKVLGQGTNIPVDQKAIITLTQTQTGNSTEITVKPGGEIE